MYYPVYRGRRLRETPTFRRMVRETRLSVDQLIYPLFLGHGRELRREVGVAADDAAAIAEDADDAAVLPVTGVLAVGTFKHAEQVVDHGSVRLFLDLLDEAGPRYWGLPLEPGRLADDCGLICRWHRSAFDLETGDVKAWAPWPPGLGRVLGATSRRKALPIYATRIEDGYIWVSLDPAE